MKEWQSLAHTKWECKYHVVIVPKYWTVPQPVDKVKQPYLNNNH